MFQARFQIGASMSPWLYELALVALFVIALIGGVQC